MGQDPLERVRQAVDAASAAEAERYHAIADAVEQGHSKAAVGRAAGVTGQRVAQILQKGPAPGPEAPFWGASDGMLTIAVGEKTEAQKEAAGPLGPVVTVEAREAYDILRALAEGAGLSAEYESIPPSTGFVKLNRDGLVVICGPRLSPHIAEIVESDPSLTFTKDSCGWYLIDREKGDREWRSPMDDGEMCDVGYLGRLPRPDGRGTFLYVGGIHAAGTSGVAHYLAGNLPELWAKVRTSRFSALIRCTLTPDRRVQTSELVAGPYMHER